MPTKAEVELENARLRADLAASEERFKEREAKTVEVAQRLAEENEWCGVVKEGLEEIGIENLDKEYIFEVSGTWRFRIRQASDSDLAWGATPAEVLREIDVSFDPNENRTVLPDSGSRVQVPFWWNTNQWDVVEVLTADDGLQIKVTEA